MDFLTYLYQLLATGMEYPDAEFQTSIKYNISSKEIQESYDHDQQS